MTKQERVTGMPLRELFHGNTLSVSLFSLCPAAFMLLLVPSHWIWGLSEATVFRFFPVSCDE